MEYNNINNTSSENDGTLTTDMKLRRLTLFSSGVGFFEHSGEISGNAEFTLPFNKAAVNDALKSIVVSDPSASPSISYHSENTLLRTMKGLSIDLRGNNHIAQLLDSLKGAEIEVLVPNPLKGRIMLVEHRIAADTHESLSNVIERESFVSLLTSEGIRIISLKEISGFAFTDPKIQSDTQRALDLIAQSRDSETRNLTVRLPGNSERKASLSYVIPTPVWKVSYRLDLSKEKPFLQGWAIVDNDSDTDWEEVELALVTGRPVSFIQNLYAPYHLSRPTLPLAIAGIAEASVYDSGTQKSPVGSRRGKSRNIVSEECIVCDGECIPAAQPKALALMSAVSGCEADEYIFAQEDDFSMTEGMVETAEGRAAGDQFEYTIKKPVNLPRQQSAMLPLVEAAVHAEKMLVFTSRKTSPGRPMNPSISAELVNNTGMKLPAAPITVYDSGTYAGDALIEFFPEGDKRIISYGEDLSVSGSFAASTNYAISAVSVRGGILYVNMLKYYKCAYTFKNATSEEKRLIVEHPFASNRAVLVEPADYREMTHNLYRFEMKLPQGDTLFEVREDELQKSEIRLSDISNVLHYASNEALPQAVRLGLRRVIDLKHNIDAEKEKVAELEKQVTRLYSEQERTRKNLEAAGPQTQQGQYYLSRLAAQENDIDAAYKAISTAEQALKDAQSAHDDYIQELCFGEGD